MSLLTSQDAEPNFWRAASKASRIAIGSLLIERFGLPKAWLLEDRLEQAFEGVIQRLYRQHMDLYGHGN